jgi:hypothetical protein
MKVWPNGFQILKNQMKFKNHDISHRGCAKNWEGFTHFIMYNVYKPKHIRRRS